MNKEINVGKVSMLDCIKRVPQILDRIINRADETFQSLFATFGSRVIETDEIIFVGSGTSYTSVFTAKYLAEKAAGVRVTVSAPNEFVNCLTARNEKALYVFVSQTGTSKLTNQALALANEAEYMTAVISEKESTPAAKAGKVFIDMNCGYEEYPMRTIGYSATVLTAMVLGMQLGLKNGHLTQGAYDAYLSDAKAASANIGSVIEKTMDWLDISRRNMLQADCLIFSGGGSLYGVALEGAVKVWETPQIISMGYEIEEGMHGPNFGYTERHCVVVLNDGGVDNDRAVSLCKFMKFEKKNGFLAGVNTVDDRDLAFTPKGKDFACLEFAAVVQVISYRLAVDQGRDLYAPHDNSAMTKYFSSHSADGKA